MTEKAKTIKDYYTPVGCMLCQDVIVEKNDLVSLQRLLDQVQAPLPVRIPLWFVAEFSCNEGITPEDFNRIKPSFQLRLENPLGQTFDLVEMQPTAHSDDRPLNIQRFMVNLTGGIEFKNEGLYTFEFFGKISDQEYKPMMRRWFRMKKVEPPGQSEPEK